MYVTAHRVRAANGEAAVHAFLHHHGDIEWPDDVAGWPESRPGELTSQRTVLPLGGNQVESYLDVLAPDGTASEALAEALQQLLLDLPERANPTVMVGDGVTLRFGTDLRLEARRTEALEELTHAVAELYKPTA